MRILIVEDEIKINKALNKGFSEEGFEADSTFNSKEAEDLLSRREYDCIILDLMIPFKDGLSLMRELRLNKNKTPIIILTAKDSTDDKVSGLDGGADDYISKPFSFEELLSRVKAVIRRSSVNEDILQINTLVLDPFKKMVRRSGREITLSKKEFSILEYLMKNKGIIISEDQIIRRIWDYDSIVTSNVVASHIKSIRNKIDKAFSNEKPIIKTIRSMGYKVDG